MCPYKTVYLKIWRGELEWIGVCSEGINGRSAYGCECLQAQNHHPAEEEPWNVICVQSFFYPIQFFFNWCVVKTAFTRTQESNFHFLQKQKQNKTKQPNQTKRKQEKQQNEPKPEPNQSNQKKNPTVLVEGNFQRSCQSCNSCHSSYLVFKSND